MFVRSRVDADMFFPDIDHVIRQVADLYRDYENIIALTK